MHCHHRSHRFSHQRPSPMRRESRRPSRSGRKAAPVVSAASQRALIVARLIAAERALQEAPDLAALRLEGILRDILHHWSLNAADAPGDDIAVFQRLEERAPAVAWRLRLALQAPSVAAKLAHCWALLELLTNSNTTTRTAIHASIHNSEQRQTRKDNTRHVS